jgi:hypothetical protein
LCLAVVVAPALANPKDKNPAGGEIAGHVIEPTGIRSPIALRYHREAAGEGRISTRIGAEGERFVGEYIRVTGLHPDAKLGRFHISWSSTVFDDFEAGPSGRPWRRTTSTVTTFRERHRGAVIAHLIGDRGSQMRCRFDLEDPASGLPGGATGACQVSTGQEIQLP